MKCSHNTMQDHKLQTLYSHCTALHCSPAYLTHITLHHMSSATAFKHKTNALTWNFRQALTRLCCRLECGCAFEWPVMICPLLAAVSAGWDGSVWCVVHVNECCCIVAVIVLGVFCGFAVSFLFLFCFFTFFL